MSGIFDTQQMQAMSVMKVPTLNNSLNKYLFYLLKKHTVIVISHNVNDVFDRPELKVSLQCFVLCCGSGLFGLPGSGSGKNQ